MSKKKIILMSNILLLLIISMSSFTAASAAAREWQPGDLYNFSYRFRMENAVTNIESGSISNSDILSEYEMTFNITDLDLVGGYYEAYIKDSSGGTTISIYDFLMSDFVDMYVTTANLFNIEYSWDYEHNRTVLTTFNLNTPVWYLIEPDWLKLSTAMINTLNASEVVFQLADPYDPIIHNFTFSQFLSDITSYSINDKNTLDTIKTKGIKDDTSVYEFFFDLSGVFYNGVFNGTLGYNQYTAFDVYKITSVIDYSEGGIMNYYQFLMEYDIITDDIYNSHLCQNIEYIFGTLEAFEANFAMIAVVPAIITVAIGIKIANKRRRKR